MRLFAHPSIFKLVEELGGKDAIDEVWGCSGGAIAGLAYCLGADHEVLEEEGYKMYHNKYSVEFLPKRGSSLKKMLFNRFLPERSVGLKGFVALQNTLQTSLERVAKHKRPTIPFYAISYNVSLKKNEVLTPEKVQTGVYDGLIKRCSPIDAVLASTAIPILFVPRIIKRGRTPITYIDGAVAEELPLPSIYTKWQLDREAGLTKKKRLFILTVNLFPELAKWKLLRYSALRRIPLVEYLSVIARVADLVRLSRIKEHVRSITTDPSVEVAVVTLGALQKSGFLNPEIIPTVIDKAKGTFFKELRSIEQRLD